MQNRTILDLKCPVVLGPFFGKIEKKDYGFRIPFKNQSIWNPLTTIQDLDVGSELLTSLTFVDIVIYV